jgi:galactokinase
MDNPSIMDTARLRLGFERLYGRSPRLYQAPGRVNLIGEHTDYNDGFVMPVALDLRTVVAMAPREDRRLRLHSLSLGAGLEFELPAPDAASVPAGAGGQWSDYACGVAVTLERAGYALAGADLMIDSTVPIGSGLSSSAALEVAVAWALLDGTGHPVSRRELARVCQRAENEYVGMRCGIMDQYASCFGRAGSAILLDCRSLEHRLLPLPGAAGHAGSLEGVRVIICDSQVRHRLAGGEYNRRRAECEEAVRLLREAEPRIAALRDVTAAMLDARAHRLPPVVRARARHVVGENARVLAAAAALEAGDLAAFGSLMRESHDSLRDDFAVSCDELDCLVRLALQVEGVYGARMTGGGFGGCTVNLVRAESADAFCEAVTTGYRRATGLTPDIRACVPADGAGPIAQD